MSEVLRIYATRRSGPTEIRLASQEGAIVIAWPYRVDPHELAKIRGLGHASTPAAEVLDRVTSTIDCQGATHWVEARA